MDSLVTLIVTVDDDIKVVAVLRNRSNELLAGLVSRTNIVNQSQITVRSKGRFACVRVHVLHEHTHKHHKQRHIHFAVLLGFLNQFQIVAVNIAVLFGNGDLIPVTLNTDYHNFLTGTELVDDLIIHACAGTHIQTGTVRYHLAGSHAVIFSFLGIVSPFLTVERENHRAIFIDDHGVRNFLGSLIFGFLRGSFHGFCLFRGSGRCTLIGVGKRRGRKHSRTHHKCQQHGTESLKFHPAFPPVHS